MIFMTKNEFRLISDGILREILRKKQILEKDPNYYLHYSNGKKKSLRNEANKHSISLELVGYNTQTSRDKKVKSREQKISEKNLRNAIDWGLNNYTGELSYDFVLNLGHLIEPRLNSKDSFRADKVRISGATWSPPGPEKLDREAKVFLYENSCLDNIIEKAVHAHFNIARIHPFYDGNGRTARAVQNLILEHSSFLPANVHLSERLEYNHLLDSAINSYKIAEGDLSIEDLQRSQELYGLINKSDISEKEKEHCKNLSLSLAKEKMRVEQGDFYNFMALKMRDTLEKEVGYLYERRT